jgi:hypothetical protein
VKWLLVLRRDFYQAILCLCQVVSFEFGQENNNTMDAKSYGKLTVKLPLGNEQKFTNFAIASKAFKDSRKMDLGALAWVERSNKIMAYLSLLRC